MKGNLRLCGHLTVTCLIRLCKQLLTAHLRKICAVRLWLEPQLYTNVLFIIICKDIRQNVIRQKLKGEPLMTIPRATEFSWPYCPGLTEAPFRHQMTWEHYQWPHPLIIVTWTWQYLGTLTIYLWSTFYVHSTVLSSMKTRDQNKKEPTWQTW